MSAVKEKQDSEIFYCHMWVFQVKSPLPSGASAHVQWHGHMIPLSVLGVQVNRIFESGQAQDQSQRWSEHQQHRSSPTTKRENDIMLKTRGNSAIVKATECKIWGAICPTQIWIEMGGKSTAPSTDWAYQAHFWAPPPRACSEQPKQPQHSSTHCALLNQKAGEHFQLFLPRVKPHIITAHNQFRTAFLFPKTRNESSNLGNHSLLPEAENMLMGIVIHALKTDGLENTR